MIFRLFSKQIKTVKKKFAVVKGSEIRWRRQVVTPMLQKRSRFDPYGFKEPVLFTPKRIKYK